MVFIPRLITSVKSLITVKNPYREMLNPAGPPPAVWQPNLDNLLRAARGDPPDTPAGGQQVDIESSMAAMKAAAAESDAARTCVQRTGVLHTHSRTHGGAAARVPARVRRTARQERLLTHHTLHTQGLCCRMQPQHAPHGRESREAEGAWKRLPESLPARPDTESPRSRS